MLRQAKQSMASDLFLYFCTQDDGPTRKYDKNPLWLFSYLGNIGMTRSHLSAFPAPPRLAAHSREGFLPLPDESRTSIILLAASPQRAEERKWNFTFQSYSRAKLAIDLISLSIKGGSREPESVTAAHIPGLIDASRAGARCCRGDGERAIVCGRHRASRTSGSPPILPASLPAPSAATPVGGEAEGELGERSIHPGPQSIPAERHDEHQPRPRRRRGSEEDKILSLCRLLCSQGRFGKSFQAFVDLNETRLFLQFWCLNDHS